MHLLTNQNSLFLLLSFGNRSDEVIGREHFMAIDYKTYIGPHVLCKTSKIESSREIKTCSNTNCTLYSQDYSLISDKKFCGYCGSPIQLRQLPIEISNVNAQEIQINLLGESLCVVPGDSFDKLMRDGDIHIWLSNRGEIFIPNKRNYSFNPRNSIQYVPMDAELILNEKWQFSNFYEKEIFILREEYGPQNVEVQWGLVHYIF